MSEEELKKELENLKDFKVYAFEGDVYVKAEDYKKIAIENKKLKEFKTKREESMFYFKAQIERAEPKTAREAEDLQKAKEMFEKLYREKLYYLEEENKKLKKEKDLYKARDEELNENCFGLAKENENLKSDLEECECSFGFENDEVGFWKGEYKKLKKRIKDHCKGYGNLFPEDEMKRQWKKADKKRKLKSTYVYDAKQVRDIC